MRKSPVTDETMRPRCLIGCSGSVATLKIPELVANLSVNFEVRVICTENAFFFLTKASSYNKKAWRRFEEVGGMSLVLRDEDEWRKWDQIGDSVLHINLRRWADVLIVAPASANLLAKAAAGISDNLLLCVLRAWDFKLKPCILCPAMNTVMWDHPVTTPTLDILREWGCQMLGPVAKRLACNEVGNGAMVGIAEIEEHLRNLTLIPGIANTAEEKAAIASIPAPLLPNTYYNSFRSHMNRMISNLQYRISAIGYRKQCRSTSTVMNPKTKSHYKGSAFFDRNYMWNKSIQCLRSLVLSFGITCLFHVALDSVISMLDESAYPVECGSNKCLKRVNTRYISSKIKY